MDILPDMADNTPLRALHSALVSITAVLASFGVMYAVCAWFGVNASPAVLAAALSVGLMRHGEKPEPRALLIKSVMLPFIALAAGLVGLALLKLPALGAALFTGGIVLSILLRRYGPRAAAVGRVIALPLMAILVVPVRMEIADQRVWVAPFLVISAGVISLVSTAAISWLALRFGTIEAPEKPRAVPPRPVREGEVHIAVRMALQMLAALSLAFIVGMLLFPEHWFWVVLTAFIVCSGAVGRGDAVHKGILRLGGAVGGAVVAALVTHIAFPDPAAYAASVFFVLFIGIWLRQINYAYWAACATLIFALLQGSHGDAIVPLLWARVLCIVIGALCGVAATWFVYPIRTDQLVRRRVADALAALRDVLAEGIGHGDRLAVLDHHAAELKHVAPPVHLHRKLFGTKEPERHPATWIDLMHGLLAEARSPDFDREQLGAGMRRLGAMLKGQVGDSVQKKGSSG